MSVRLRSALRTLVTCPPLNRPVTRVLRTVLPERARQHPALARYLPRTGVVDVTMPDGTALHMHSRGDDGIAGPLFWRGWAGHEPETVARFYELAGSASVTLDIGAHVGWFALVAAHANPAGHVYAFEPLPRVRERLQRNVELNGTTNVTCLPLAVGSPPGTAELFHVREGIPSSSSLSGGFMHSIVTSRELTSTTVEVIEVDGFVDAQGLARVDLVKIDTETTEAAVIRGMLRTLERDHPAVVCEVLDAGVGHAIEQILRPLGYEFRLLTSDGEVRTEHIVPHPTWRNYLFLVTSLPAGGTTRA